MRIKIVKIEKFWNNLHFKLFKPGEQYPMDVPIEKAAKSAPRDARKYFWKVTSCEIRRLLSVGILSDEQ